MNLKQLLFLVSMFLLGTGLYHRYSNEWWIVYYLRAFDLAGIILAIVLLGSYIYTKLGD